MDHVEKAKRALQPMIDSGMVLNVRGGVWTGVGHVGAGEGPTPRSTVVVTVKTPHPNRYYHEIKQILDQEGCDGVNLRLVGSEDVPQPPQQ